MRIPIITIFVFILACVSRVVPPSAEMASTYALLQNAREEGGETYAPHVVKDARFFYDQAERELAKGNHEMAEEFRLISEIRAKTAISIAKKKLYENEIQGLDSQINEASSIKKANEDELRKNASRLEQIKDRIAVSQERMHSSVLDTLEKAGEKIKAAEDVSAEDFDNQALSEARETYREAQESLNLGEYERSMELGEKATAFAQRAYEDSKKKFDLRSEILQKVSRIYRAEAESVKEGVRVTLQGVFAPSGTTIFFDAYPSLDVLGDVLNEYPNLRVIIEAYTNDLRSEEENLKLSQTQAEAVKNYLVSKGLSSERFKVEDFSSRKPQNRSESPRIEFTIDLLESGNI
jgi:outer membrane protein OmpA-like peptidoglycan-associated protein